MSQSVNQKIEMAKEKLKTSLDSFIKDKLTGCYNHIFLNEYLINELDLISHESIKQRNLLLIYIKIDNIMDINVRYSNKIGDETISNLSYLLNEVKKDTEMLFKLNGPNFVILSHNFRGSLNNYVRNIQNSVKKADLFIEPITVSCSIISLSEINDKLDTKEKAEALLTKGISRINLSYELGDSSFIDKDTIIERNFFGNILIAEGDPLTLSIMKSYFEENKYNVDAVSDGLEALNKAKEKKYDVIIADRYVKKIDGLTLKKYINEASMNMNTMFLMTIQSKNVDIVKKANLISIDMIFDKPVILEELLGIIQRETYKRECMLL